MPIVICHLSKSLFTTCDKFVQEDGVILKRTGDYGTRAGVTAKPIATNSVLSVQVLLHALLRSFDHFMKTAVHVKAHVFDWTESPSSHNMWFLKQAKEETQNSIYQATGIKWDYPDSTGKGGTTTGPVARALWHDSANRELIVSEMPNNYQDIFRKFGTYLLESCHQNRRSELKIINSSAQNFISLYNSFPEQILHERSEPWISITPSLHKLPGHSWEIIQINEGFGLGSLDESGMEECNKLLRAVRTRLTRKTLQSDNLNDTKSYVVGIWPSYLLWENEGNSILQTL